MDIKIVSIVMRPLTADQLRLWKIAAGIVVVGTGVKV